MKKCRRESNMEAISHGKTKGFLWEVLSEQKPEWREGDMETSGEEKIQAEGPSDAKGLRRASAGEVI